MDFSFLKYFVVVAVCSIVAPSSLLSAERSRQALIIGNAAYQIDGVPELKNAVNDAVLMDKTLRDIGFQTTLLTNTTKQQMKQAIGKFAQRLDTDSVGLFYYAGHGVEVNGRNYLVPIDAGFTHESQVEHDAVDASRVLSAFKSANNGLNLMILDACRNDPFIQSSSRSIERGGLAAMRPASGSLVLYATEPGDVASDNPHGQNGLFTKNLVESIKQPGLKIEDVYKRTAINVRDESGKKQTPYLEGSILGDFIFTEDDSSAPENDSAGSITITTRPSGATVYIGGVDSGVTPTQINGLEKGNYDITVSRTGYITQKQRIRLDERKNERLNLSLSAIVAPKVGRVPPAPIPIEEAPVARTLYPFTVTTHPRNARVRILNITPVYSAGMQLSPGSYHVEVSANGYSRQTRYIRHKQRETYSHFELERLQPVVVASPSIKAEETVAVDSVEISKPEAIRNPIDQKDAELVFWTKAKDENTAEAYRLYLRLYPKGTFRMVANMKLQNLGG